MNDRKTKGICMAVHLTLTADNSEVDISKHPYSQLAGSMKYLAACVRGCRTWLPAYVRTSLTPSLGVLGPPSWPTQGLMHTL